MKKSILIPMILATTSMSAEAAILYDNTTPLSGTLNAISITHNVLTESFNLSADSTNITAVNFDVWQTDYAQTQVTAVISTDIAAKNVLTAFSGLATAYGTFAPAGSRAWKGLHNQINIELNNLNAGTYYLTLKNASDNGNTVFWDVSNGPSKGWNGYGAPLPNYSNGFQIIGNVGNVGTVPLPPAVLTFATAIIGFAVSRRKTI